MTLGPLIEEEARSLDDADQRAAKKAAALEAVKLVESGMMLGLGTGSTVTYFLEALAARVKSEGLRVQGVPTSLATEALARQHGIPLVSNGYANLANDLCVDGADRVDDEGHLIKGGGGALLREKMVAAHSKRLCILVDASKLEAVFSGSFPLPVECVPFGIESTMALLSAQGCEPRLRLDGEALKMTDNGNCVVDCVFSQIPDPELTQASLLNIPGVVEVGLFCHLLATLVLGRPDGSSRIWVA